MQRFFYKAKKTSGEIITGEIDAADDASAVIKLQETGVYPVTLEPQESSFSVKKKLKKEVPSFTRQLSDLVSSDIPLVKSLNILSKQTKNKDWQKLLTSVSEKVERGQDFSSSRGAHPDIFDKIYTGIVRAGEESGTLNTSLERLSEYYEKRLEIIGKIKSTLTYPIAVFSVGLLTLAFLVIFVMPRFASMFRDIGRALPLPTKILILLSNTARYGWWVYVPLVVVVYLYLKKYLKTEKGKIAFERFKMSLPVVGDIFLYTIVTRFCLTMGTLIKNGIPLLDSVKYAEESTGS
ncbi:MAG: type II secretion system F family protein, partial [Elusimicrobiota bacterium]